MSQPRTATRSTERKPKLLKPNTETASADGRPATGITKKQVASSEAKTKDAPQTTIGSSGPSSKGPLNRSAQ
jgi:hypothetical protein